MLLNPKVLVEVLSDGTKRYDRGEARSGERVALQSIDCELVVDDLYQGVLDD